MRLACTLALVGALGWAQEWDPTLARGWAAGLGAVWVLMWALG
jgi:hypothetical protein